ncbi:MAG: TIGR01777 family oxidoreductase [Pseudomonadota bacterium]
MHILVAGGTGFIGKALCQHLLQLGHQVTILTRNIRRQKSRCKGLYASVRWISVLDPGEGAYYDAIINLAGEPLNAHRWTQRVKNALYSSRITFTQRLVDYIHKMPVKPQVLINASAIGFYGHSQDFVFTESSEPSDGGFTHRLCADWEAVALQAEQYGVRVCCIRTGIVLGKGGGALQSMALPFKWFLGAQLGSGRQWMSWIHIDDVLRAIDFMLDKPNMRGAYNLTATEPVTHAHFVHSLAVALRRPCWFTLPAWLVRILFGEMGDALLLKGQKVIPARLMKRGFVFKFTKLEAALADIVKS